MFFLYSTSDKNPGEEEEGQRPAFAQHWKGHDRPFFL
jgi:hypothetical protein